MLEYQYLKLVWLLLINNHENAYLALIKYLIDTNIIFSDINNNMVVNSIIEIIIFHF